MLELNSWNRLYIGQLLFLNFRDVLKKTPLWLRFHFWKQKEITRNQIRQVVGVFDHIRVLGKGKWCVWFFVCLLYFAITFDAILWTWFFKYQNLQSCNISVFPHRPWKGNYVSCCAAITLNSTVLILNPFTLPKNAAKNSRTVSTMCIEVHKIGLIFKKST